MFCPTCRDEFRPDIEACPDCGVPLVEALEPVAHPEPEPFVTIDRFHDLGAANVAEGLLGAAGLEARLRDEQTVGLNWMLAPAIGGVRLEVRESQAQLARDLLAAEGSQTPRLELPVGDGEEAAYRRHQTRRKRAKGVVGLAALFSPVLLAIGAVVLALSRGERGRGAPRRPAAPPRARGGDAHIPQDLTRRP